MRGIALGVGMMLLTLSPASAETLCVRGDVYIELGQIVAPSDIVKRGVSNAMECPDGSVAYVQETDKRVLTSTEIKRIRDRMKEVAEKESE